MTDLQHGSDATPAVLEKTMMLRPQAVLPAQAGESGA
jgi:hypothetical protein